jgi:hypothetical protein
MPLYEYQCDSCGQRFEAIRKFSDPPLEVCAKCGKGPITKLVSSPAFTFKGTGFYITDYAKKNSPSPSESSSGDSKAKSDTKAESKSETKTETKTESKPASTPESK